MYLIYVSFHSNLLKADIYCANKKNTNYYNRDPRLNGYGS